MHLLVLSAFRLKIHLNTVNNVGLNAPFGAQCFPTGKFGRLKRIISLNAPFGAQCFPTVYCS